MEDVNDLSYDIIRKNLEGGSDNYGQRSNA